MEEKEIEGYTKYTINKDGEVYSTKWGKLRKLKPQPASQSKKKYLQVRLYDGSGKLGKLQYVHRLVWETFVGEIPEGMEIDHINADPSCNKLQNLQVVSRKGNMAKFARQYHGTSLRENRDELIKDYEELGTFEKVAEKWGVSIPAVFRVIRNRVHTKLKGGKYGSRPYDENINDDYSI